MNRFISSKYILIAVLLLAAVLRIWKLGSIPPGLTPDEASLGYNAYSLLKTGRDEYGELLPIIFKSFGDFKPGLYVYLAVPSIAFFGLNEFAVRLPGAILGTIAIWFVYLIVRIITDEKWFKLYVVKKKISSSVNSQLIAISASLLLTVSPWHIHYSRGAWEVNVALTFTLIGIYFFLRAFQNSKFLVLSSIFFALTYITYQGAKLSTTIAIFTLITVYLNRVTSLLKNSFLTVAISALLGIVIVLPILLSLFQAKTGRLTVFSIFSYQRQTEKLQTFLDEGNEKIGYTPYYIYHSEGLNFVRAILGRYFNHFSTRFLFFEGDWQNPKQSAPNHGMLLLIDLLFLLVGFTVLIKSKGKAKWFILIWLLLSPLPSAFSRDEVQAVRALNMVIPLVFVSSFGLAKIVTVLYESKYKNVLTLTFFLLFAVNFIYYLDAYFVHLPKHTAKQWFYGYREAVKYILPIEDSYDTIVFQQSYSQPYIYFLFYGASLGIDKYSPAIYQQSNHFEESKYGDVGLVNKLNNILFESFSWVPPKREGKTLYVGDDIIIPNNVSDPEFKIVTKLLYPNGSDTAFTIVELIK